jgi:DMSO/TMAO reductase YedYZ molybdopterin-dependent catalytic subunit
MRRLAVISALVLALVAGVVVATGVAGAKDSSRHDSQVSQSSPGAFDIVGNVEHRLVLNTRVLEKLPSKTLQVTYRSGPGTETRTFTGPLLRDVLALAGPRFDPAVRNDKLRHYVSATGSDGYMALVAWGEIDPEFGNEDILLATHQDGVSLATEGPRLVVPGDDRGGRYVSGIVRIRVDRGR